MHRAATCEAMTIDGEIPDVCMVRESQDEHDAVEFLASGSNLSQRTIVALPSMGPTRRRRVVRQIEALGLTVRRLRRRDLHYDRAGYSPTDRLVALVRRATVAIIAAPFVGLQFGLRLFGRGHRTLLVNGRVEGPRKRPPDAGVREPRKPLPSAPSAAMRLRG